MGNSTVKHTSFIVFKKTEGMVREVLTKQGSDLIPNGRKVGVFESRTALSSLALHFDLPPYFRTMVNLDLDQDKCDGSNAGARNVLPSRGAWHLHLDGTIFGNFSPPV